MPYVRRIPAVSFAPQYWDMKTAAPEHIPKVIIFKNQPNWPAIPTAERERSPSCPTIMVSTRMKELVSRFCIATGKASFSAMRQKPISPKYFLNI